METFSTLLAIFAGNSPVTGEFPAQRPVTRSFDAFFNLRLNKRLSKQWWAWRFETPSRPLWRHCNYSSHFRFSVINKPLNKLSICYRDFKCYDTHVSRMKTLESEINFIASLGDDPDEEFIIGLDNGLMLNRHPTAILTHDYQDH